jgi:hypothetical protein
MRSWPPYRSDVFMTPCVNKVRSTNHSHQKTFKAPTHPICCQASSRDMCLTIGGLHLNAVALSTKLTHGWTIFRVPAEQTHDCKLEVPKAPQHSRSSHWILPWQRLQACNLVHHLCTTSKSWSIEMIEHEQHAWHNGTIQSKGVCSVEGKSINLGISGNLCEVRKSTWWLISTIVNPWTYVHSWSTKKSWIKQ